MTKFENRNAKRDRKLAKRTGMRVDRSAVRLAEIKAKRVGK